MAWKVFSTEGESLADRCTRSVWCTMTLAAYVDKTQGPYTERKDLSPLQLHMPRAQHTQAASLRGGLCSKPVQLIGPFQSLHRRSRGLRRHMRATHFTHDDTIGTMWHRRSFGEGTCVRKELERLVPCVAFVPHVCRSPRRPRAPRTRRYSAFLGDCHFASACHLSQQHSSSAAEKRPKLAAQFPGPKTDCKLRAPTVTEHVCTFRGTWTPAERVAHAAPRRSRCGTRSSAAPQRCRCGVLLALEAQCPRPA